MAKNTIKKWKQQKHKHGFRTDEGKPVPPHAQLHPAPSLPQSVHVTDLRVDEDLSLSIFDDLDPDQELMISPAGAEVGQVITVDEDEVGTRKFSATDQADLAVSTAAIISDGAAPANSPTPVVQGGIGYLAIKWDTIVNTDPVTYEVYIGTTAGFTADATTLALETPATTVFVRKDPDDADFEYGTTYYVRVAAKDADGSAAVSSAVAGTLVAAANSDLSEALIGGDNLVQNPSFEDEDNGWWENNNATLEYQNTDVPPKHGDSVLKLTRGASSSTMDIRTGGAVADDNTIPVVVGRTYTSSVWVRAAAVERNVTIYHQYKDSSSAIISTPFNTIVDGSSPGVWKLCTVTSEAPAGAVFMTGYWRINETLGAGEVHYMDAVRCGQGEVAAFAAVGVNDLLANSVIAEKILAGSISADKFESVLAIVSALLAGDEGGARVEMGHGITAGGALDSSFTGIRAFDSAGNLVFKLDAGGGTALFKGKVDWGTASHLKTNDTIEIAEQPGGSWQTPNLEQSPSGGKTIGVSTTTGSATWESATISGNELIMVVTASNVGSGAPTFTTPAGWTLVTGPTFDSGNSRRAIYRRTSTGQSGTQSITFSSAPDVWTVQLFEYSGVSNTEDGANSTSAGSSTPADSGTSGALSQQDLVFAAIAWRAPSGAAVHPSLSSPTNGFTQAGSVGSFTDSGARLGAYAYTKTASSATQTVSATTNDIFAWGGIILTLKAKAVAVDSASANAVRVYGKDVTGVDSTHTTRLHTVDEGGVEGAVVLGKAGEVWRMELFSLANNLPSTAAHVGGAGTLAITGLAVGDYAFFIGQTDNATTARSFLYTVNPLCAVAGQVSYVYFNTSASTVDPGSQTLYFLVIHRS